MMNNKSEALGYCPICKNTGKFINYGDGMMVEETCKCKYGEKMNNKAEALREKIADRVNKITYLEAIGALSKKQYIIELDEILALCAEVARECVDSTQGTIMSVRKHGYEREYVLKSKAKHEINKAFGVDDESPVTPYEQKITCSKCGIDFSGTTGYVCSNTDCPMGLNGTTC